MQGVSRLCFASVHPMSYTVNMRTSEAALEHAIKRTRNVHHIPDADATRPDVAPGGHRGGDDGVGEEDSAQSEQNTTEDTKEDFVTEVDFFQPVM